MVVVVVVVGKRAHLEQVAPPRAIHVREGRRALEGERTCVRDEVPFCPSPL